MRKLFAILAFSLTCSAQTNITGKVQLTAKTSFDVPGAVAGAWSDQTANLPAAATATAHNYFKGTDGYIYEPIRTGTTPSFVTSVHRQPVTAGVLGADQDITGTGLPGGTRAVSVMWQSLNGTLYIADTDNGGTPGNAKLYFWNGSTGSPVWAQVSGFTPYTGDSSFNNGSFWNDASGYVYFTVPWKGDVWKSSTPDGTTFSKILTNAYAYSGNGTGTGTACNAGVTPLGGAPDTGCSGGIYPLRLWDLADGAGLNIWGCGEGGVLRLGLTGTPFTNWGTGPSGFTNNCIALAKSATTILFIRPNAGGTQWLCKLDVATLTQSCYASPSPFPSNPSNNAINPIHWLHGTTFILTTKNGTTPYLYISTDDGATWTDMQTLGTMPAGCSGANLEQFAVNSSTFVFAPAQSGKHLCSYGPI